MIFEEKYRLSNGVQIPKVGLGTWMIDDDKVPQTIHDAVRVGYRHFDTAQGYGNERGVGEGVRTCGINRNEIFVTTKLASEIKEYKKAVKAIDGSLQRMGLDYIDLMIIHSPQPWEHYREGDYFDGNLEAWRALEEAYKAGKLRAIGLSNFEQKDVDNIIKNGSEAVMVNQILAHISNISLDLMKYCEDRGILMEAYSPIAHGEAMKNPKIVDMAAKYGVSVPQLCIRYVLELGMVALPKTKNPEHMKSNAQVEFRISPEDMKTLNSLERIKNYGDDLDTKFWRASAARN